MSYLKWVSNRPDRQSWHVLERVDDVVWHLRCGRIITTDKAEASQHLPAGQKTCESCAAGRAPGSGAGSVTGRPG